MKTRSQITFASLALLIAGSSLLYTTPASIVKAESTENVSSSSHTSTQRDRNSVKQAMRDTLHLGFPGILVKTYEGGKTW
ncbi:D-alanyl-D-alanine carboxypeptidase, partial [Bacillus wiedmannii]|nr:D-alanyl-D-alanine carboxypeptidase [Bacillus wiedmannii]